MRKKKHANFKVTKLPLISKSEFKNYKSSIVAPTLN